jgi:hypothetical protein
MISRLILCFSTFLVLSSYAQTVHKNILVESFVGHVCGNCGSMDYAIELKDAQYGDSLVFVSIHPNTSFNEPSIGPNFTADFRIEEGEQTREFFSNPESLPRAMISRQESVVPFFFFNANQIDAEVDARIGVNAKFDMSCIAYMNSSREIISEVTITNLDTVSGAYKLINYIVEDSVIDWQVVYPGQHPSYDTGAAGGAYPNYAHRYVLRDVNGHIGVLEGAPIYTGDIFGLLISGPIPVGSSTVISEVSHAMPIAWNENKVSLVSFIIDTITHEVMQVINTPVTYTISTNEIESVSLSIYPNPAKELVVARLSHHMNDARIKVISMNGSLIIDQAMNSDQVAINVSSLNAGIYVVLIQHENGIVSGRLVVE